MLKKLIDKIQSYKFDPDKMTDKVNKSGRAFDGNWRAVFVALGMIGLAVLMMIYLGIQALVT